MRGPRPPPRCFLRRHPLRRRPSPPLLLTSRRRLLSQNGFLFPELAGDAEAVRDEGLDAVVRRLGRSTYPAACSLSTSGASSKSRRNSPRGTNPRITGASPHCRRARRPRHRPSVGSDWRPSVRRGAADFADGSDSRLFHAHSGQPDAAACSSLCTSLRSPPRWPPRVGFLHAPMAALGPPGIGHLNLIPSPARENFKSYKFASRSPSTSPAAPPPRCRANSAFAARSRRCRTPGGGSSSPGRATGWAVRAGSRDSTAPSTPRGTP